MLKYLYLAVFPSLMPGLCCECGHVVLPQSIVIPEFGNSKVAQKHVKTCTSTEKKRFFEVAYMHCRHSRKSVLLYANVHIVWICCMYVYVPGLYNCLGPIGRL